MSAPRAGSAFPLHPDNYHGGLLLGADIEADLLAEGDLEFTDEQLDAKWAEEQVIRGSAPKHTHFGCGHECESGACHLFGMTKDFFCHDCEMKTWKHW